MQYRIGAAGDAFDPNLSRSRVQERQQLCGAAPYIFMRITGRLTLGLPTLSRLGDSLIRPRFIFIPYNKSPARRRLVRLLDQLFFASVSGSMTLTTPLLRRR
jgi:hypothetical protein